MSYKTLRYVDTVETVIGLGKSYLYRGGAPLTTDPNGNIVFDYDGLRAAIKNPPPHTPRPPIPPPESYYLVVINLVHSDEGPNITAEATYFWNQGPNANQGQVHFWDTYGTGNCYFRTPADDRPHLVATLGEWLPDPLIWRVKTLRTWLELPSTLPFGPVPTPIVVYVHCDGGCDRTSEMIGAYRLCYPPADWPPDEVWQRMCAEHPCDAPMGCDNYMATQWYAYWLNQTKGRSITGIGVNDGGCNDGGTTWAKCSA
jgi:hypothetical protein